MSRSSWRRVGLVAVIVATAFAGLSAPALAEESTGTITGQYTKNGQPVTPGDVVILSADTGNAVFSQLDEDGRFTAAELPPGQYRVAFDVNFMRQYAFGKLTFSDADLIDVVAGQTTTVNDEALPTGMLAGRVTQPDGTTPAGAEVVAHVASDFFFDFARTNTDADGRWQLEVPAADYKISFRSLFGEGFADQWAHQQVSGYGADVFTVTAGEQTTVDESLLPIGSISGRFTDQNGQAIAGGNVNLSDMDGNFVTHADTDDSGAYAFPALPATSYKIEFATPDFGRVQYARGKLTIETADPIVVEGGQNTVVDEQLLALGAIRVRARDAANGEVIRNICVLFGEGSVCDNGSGEVLIENVPPGQQFIIVESSEARYFGADAEVTVAPGQTTEITVTMRRAATINTRVLDRVTGEPVAGACVELVPPDRLRLGNSQIFCSDAAGALRVGPIDPGTFRLFVHVFDGPYGRQWVGLNGGTGRLELARTVKAVTGKVVTLPPIKMDRAGTVEGVVTGDSGQPLFLAGVRINSQHPGVGGAIGVETDENGRYSFTGLGPYEWPLLFEQFGYASQWSGGVANRLLATGVRVREGQTTTFDVRLTTGTTLTGTIRTQAGTPLDDGFLTAHNVVTGDYMGAVFFVNGQYTLHVLGPQLVRLQVQGSAGEQFYNHWYVDAADFEHATPVVVPEQGTKTVNITVSRTAT